MWRRRMNKNQLEASWVACLTDEIQNFRALNIDLIDICCCPAIAVELWLNCDCESLFELESLKLDWVPGQGWQPLFEGERLQHDHHIGTCVMYVPVSPLLCSLRVRKKEKKSLASSARRREREPRKKKGTGRSLQPDGSSSAPFSSFYQPTFSSFFLFLVPNVYVATYIGVLKKINF